MLYVDDLIEAMLSAVTRIDRTAGQVYNLGAGPEHNLGLGSSLRKPRRAYREYPKAPVRALRPGDQRIYVSDTRKAQRDLDRSPKVGITEGLRRMIEDWEFCHVTVKTV